ncbi:hypothetical protein GCM10022226_73720 [Sphaerisporangium flaviroseum]|uniref:Lipoprotein n=1 Tax=Sphaerisporangium flaviroseum TaxID=509199 RepID=A0ABP7JCS8_9ACTN
MTRRLASVVLAAAAIALCSAACSTGGPAQASPTPTPSRDDVQRELAIKKRFAQCGREHGYPAMRDPVIENGEVHFPAVPGMTKEKMIALEEIPECRKILNEMPSLTDRNRPNPPADAATMRKTRQYAQCLRKNGVPEFPDPKPDGSFPVSGTPLESEIKPPSQRMEAARKACVKYDTNHNFS